MCHESIVEQWESGESAMIESEDLSEQIWAFESEETECGIEEKEGEDDREKRKM